MWECPDFFAVDGHHVLLYSTENKVFWTTGEYDTHKHLYFPMKSGVLDHQSAYYAPKSFVAPDGRRVLWGWLRELRPDAQFSAAGWSGAMSLPRVLGVNRDGYLEMNPAAECEKLRGDTQSATVTSSEPLGIKLDSLRREINISLSPQSPKFSVSILSDGAKVWELVVDVPGRTATCGDISIPLPQPPWTRDNLRIFLDASVIETFIVGREALTSRVYNIAPDKTELRIELLGGESIPVEHWPLQAISPDRLTT
jgi:beta-fructofuranosidase